MALRAAGVAKVANRFLPKIAALRCDARSPDARSWFDHAIGGPHDVRVHVVLDITDVLLSAAPFRYGPFAIGLFGLAGLFGAVAAQGGGRLHDNSHDLAGTIGAWLLVLVAFALCALGGHSLLWLLAGTVLFDLAIQTQRILNQSQAFALAPNSRSRINTVYIAGNFVGAACGSLLATALWTADGWPGVTSTGAGTAILALTICAVRALRRGRPAH